MKARFHYRRAVSYTLVYDTREMRSKVDELARILSPNERVYLIVYPQREKNENLFSVFRVRVSYILMYDTRSTKKIIIFF